MSLIPSKMVSLKDKQAAKIPNVVSRAAKLFTKTPRTVSKVKAAVKRVTKRK